MKTKPKLSNADIADALEISRSTLWLYRRRPDSPKTHDLAAWREWLAKYRAALPTADPETKRLQNELLEARIVAARHALETERAKYVPLVEVREGLEQMRQRAAAILAPIPAELAPQVATASIAAAERILRARIHAALYEMAGDKPAETQTNNEVQP